MLWALLAILGVPIWLIVGALLVVATQRRRFLRTPGVFPCKLRLHAGRFDGLGERWSRKAHAYWVHDVLLVGRGAARARLVALPVESPQSETRSAVVLKGLGPDPVSQSLVLDDGAIVEVAVPTSAGGVLTGPFLAAEAEFTAPPRP